MCINMRETRKRLQQEIIHLPCNPINNKFPQAMSDKLAHAVICPRVLKPMKINKYSKTYQMHEIRGNFTGLDSCDLLEYGTWMKKSMISFKNEALQVYGRADMRSRLMKLAEQEEWPQDHCDAICQYSDEIEEKYGESINKALNGVTYIPIRDCIKINASLADQTQSVDESEVDGERIETMYTAPWPCVHSDIHHYGMQWLPYETKLPSFKDIQDDQRILWILMSMAVSSKLFYECMVKSVYSQEQWHGWFLQYLYQQTREATYGGYSKGEKIYKGKIKSENVM